MNTRKPIFAPSRAYMALDTVTKNDLIDLVWCLAQACCSNSNSDDDQNTADRILDEIK